MCSRTMVLMKILIRLESMDHSPDYSLHCPGYLHEIEQLFFESVIITDFSGFAQNLYGGNYEIPKKACEGDIFHVMAYAFFKCLIIEEFHFRFLFGFKIYHVLFLGNAPLFMFVF